MLHIIAYSMVQRGVAAKPSLVQRGVAAKPSLVQCGVASKPSLVQRGFVAKPSLFGTWHSRSLCLECLILALVIV